jgi:Mn-dependent DtxR family transcriptional regulator
MATETHTHVTPGMRRVYEAIITLAIEHGPPPSQPMIAALMDVSQQYVGQQMQALERAGMIRWIGRYTYVVDRAQWIPPDNPDM